MRSALGCSTVSKLCNPPDASLRRNHPRSLPLFGDQEALMSYYIATSILLPFDQAIEATVAALAEQGFGVISRIDIQATLKTKIGADFRP